MTLGFFRLFIFHPDISVGDMSVQVFWPFFNWLFVFLLLSLGSPYTFKIWAFSQIVICGCFLPVRGLSFHRLNGGGFWQVLLFILTVPSLSISLLLWITHLLSNFKYLCPTQGHKDFLQWFLLEFIFFIFYIKSMIYFEVFFFFNIVWDMDRN